MKILLCFLIVIDTLTVSGGVFSGGGRDKNLTPPNLSEQTELTVAGVILSALGLSLLTRGLMCCRCFSCLVTLRLLVPSSRTHLTCS